ncbi:hypothetical protein ACPA2N_25830 [Ectopseudomonas hydrolytica]|uniref:hypothetical protein n=1 Tax=Ectopseudomonas hydrolytica TaxID=2493633 RepID=UPI003C2D6F00
MTIGWAPKKNRDGQPTPGCWMTDGGYTVAQFQVDGLPVYAVTAQGDSVAMTYRKSRAGVVQAITDHMAGRAVAKFEGEGA